MKRVSIFLVAIALVAGMVGCNGNGGTSYALTIASTSGGSVTEPGEGNFTYDEGTVVNLTAEAEEGYQFVEWTGDVSTIADANYSTTNITMNDSYNITANFYSILLVANHEVEQVIAASLEWYADWGVWPRDTADTCGNYSFYDYIDGTLGASYSFDVGGFINGVGDPGGIGGGTTSSEYNGIHWENPIPPTVGHGHWASDY